MALLEYSLQLNKQHKRDLIDTTTMIKTSSKTLVRVGLIYGTQLPDKVSIRVYTLTGHTQTPQTTFLRVLQCVRTDIII